MFAWSRDRVLVVALLTLHVTAMIVVLGFVFGWWSGSDDEASLEPISGNLADGPGVDGPTITPAPSGSLATATPGESTLSEATTTPTTAPATPAPSATSAPPTNTPAPQPTSTPVPQSMPGTPSPAAPASTPVDFSGRWRITDVVTQGSNAGETFSFEVSLLQQGDQVFGGNSGIRINGTVSGDTATVEYVQPALGYTGTFVWTLVGPNSAAGTFTNSYPNSGISTLQRLQ